MENYNYTIIQEKESNNIKYYKVKDFTEKTFFIEEYKSVGYSDWDASDKIREDLKKLQKEKEIVDFFDETNFVDDQKTFFKVYSEDNFNYKSIFDNKKLNDNLENSFENSFDIESSNDNSENSFDIESPNDNSENSFENSFDIESSNDNSENSFENSFDIESLNNNSENLSFKEENSFEDDSLRYNNYLKENYLEDLEERAFSSFKDNPQDIKRKEDTIKIYLLRELIEFKSDNYIDKVKYQEKKEKVVRNFYKNENNLKEENKKSLNSSNSLDYSNLESLYIENFIIVKDENRLEIVHKFPKKTKTNINMAFLFTVFLLGFFHNYFFAVILLLLTIFVVPFIFVDKSINVNDDYFVIVAGKSTTMLKKEEVKFLEIRSWGEKSHGIALIDDKDLPHNLFNSSNKKNLETIKTIIEGYL